MRLASLSRLDRRVLGALELRRAATGERITTPMEIASASLGFVRNRSGLHVINALNPRKPDEILLAAHLKAFEKAPDVPPTHDVEFDIVITDPIGRYLPRMVTITLPRGAQTGEPITVDMALSSTAPVGQNWSGIRASLLRATTGGDVPLAGARVTLLRDSDDTELGSGIADERGEVLALAVGIPIIDFDTAPSPSPSPTPAPAPVQTKKVRARFTIETAPGLPWPTNPDAITESGQSWVPVSGDLPTLELETGRVLTDGLRFQLKEQT